MNTDNQFSSIKVLRSNSGLDYLLDIIEEEFDNKVYICGGYARYVTSYKTDPAPASDVDLFCLNQETYDEVYKFFSYCGVHHDSSNAVKFNKRYSDDYKELSLLPPIQLIKHRFGSIEEILSSFDFTIIQIGIMNKLLAKAHPKSLEDDKYNNLVITNIQCPILQFARINKYIKLGYHIRSAELAKVFNKWSSLSNTEQLKIIEETKDIEFKDRSVGYPRNRV